jgi:hypothetical protein
LRFGHPDGLFEPKIDGFRALAYIDGHRPNPLTSFETGRVGPRHHKVVLGCDVNPAVADDFAQHPDERPR